MAIGASHKHRSLTISVKTKIENRPNEDTGANREERSGTRPSFGACLYTKPDLGYLFLSGRAVLRQREQRRAVRQREDPQHTGTAEVPNPTAVAFYCIRNGQLFMCEVYKAKKGESSSNSLHFDEAPPAHARASASTSETRKKNALTE